MSEGATHDLIRLEPILPQLVQLHDRGLLVPFIGAGMSRPSCAGWGGFVENLEGFVHSGEGSSEGASAPDLIQRAFFAVQYLRRKGPEEFPRRIFEALDYRPSIPASTRALGSIYWPLVLTTNYDDLFLREIWKGFQVTYPDQIPRLLGRTPGDCRRLLAGLDFPSGPTIWALQGFLLSDAVRQKLEKKVDAWRRQQERYGSSPRAGRYEQRASAVARFLGHASELEKELVVGHSEYRDVTHTAVHFRRAFAEVFRRRSLFFLGSGLSEPYFLTLFGEVLELSGPGPTPHFALLEKGSVDADFMRARFNMTVIEIPARRFECVKATLEKLQDALQESRAKTVRWSIDVRSPRRLKSKENVHFEVVRAALPSPGELGPDTECLAISCGRDSAGRPLLSGVGRAAAQLKDETYEWAKKPWIVRFPHHPRSSEGLGVFGIVARHPTGSGSSRDRRDLRVIATAVREFLEFLESETNLSKANVQLLAAGSKRAFPPWYSLIQTVRGYREWLDLPTKKKRLIRLSLYVVAPDVLALLASGQLDLNELLNCRDLRITSEVTEGDRLDRRILFLEPTNQLQHLADELGLSPEQWSVDLEPAPSFLRTTAPLADVAMQSLEQWGVIPGSTIKFYRTTTKPNEMP